jgi:hypothetical protein
MHWDRLAKDQPAEITIVRISEVQESPAFNGRRSFLTLRVQASLLKQSRKMGYKDLVRRRAMLYRHF